MPDLEAKLRRSQNRRSGGSASSTGTGKMVRKGDLPKKTCAACGLPFAWRKKWARDWEQVRYCSDRCRGAARA